VRHPVGRQLQLRAGLGPGPADVDEDGDAERDQREDDDDVILSSVLRQLEDLDAASAPI
jgi:hypothetical protein